MIRKLLMLCAALLLTGGGASAQTYNQTPAAQIAVLEQSYRFAFGNDGDTYKNTQEANHNTIIELEGPNPPAIDDPEVTIDDFQIFVLDSQIGTLFFSSVGGTGGVGVEVRQRVPAGYNATITARNAYVADPYWEDDELYVGGSANGHHVGITDVGLERHYTSDGSVVYAIWEGSQSLAGSFCDNLAFVGYAGGVPDNAAAECDIVWTNLAGSNGYQRRILNAALTGTTLTLTGNGATVMAPCVLGFYPGPNTTLNGPFDGWVQFDALMEGSPDAMVDGSNGFLVRGARWDDPGNPTKVLFTIDPVRSGLDNISASGYGARSAGGRIALDGDRIAPNEDSYYVLLNSTVGSPNTAAAFDFAKAWQEPDGLHLAWITGAEHNSNRFEVFAGPNKERLLVTVPATGGPLKPHYYEVVLPSDGSDVFQIYEEDSDPEVDYATPYFSLSPRPENLDGLRSVNATVESWPDPADPMRYAGLPESGEAPLRDVSPHYVFITTRSDFLIAVQPVIDWLEDHGKIVATVVAGSPNPDLIRDFLDDYYGQAVQQGRPIPFVYLVGEANEGSVPAYNVVGMEYFSDPDCFWGSCSSDLDLVDFNQDGKPEMNWSRILAHDVPTLQKSVATYLEVLNGQNLSAPRVLILNGDGNATCVPQPEPTATLQTIAQLYQSEGVPVTWLHDSQLPCSDWLARRTAAVNAVNAGITELIGAGRVSNRINGFFIVQKQFQSPWDMNLLTRRQHIVVELPGCGLGDADRNFADQTQYPGLAYTFLNYDPTLGTTAVAWHSLSRGAPEPQHLLMARTYFAQRWSGTVHTSHEAHFRAIRECWELYPELRSYLRRAVNYGWETRLDGMIIAVGDPAPAPAPPQVLRASPNPFSQFTAIRYAVSRTAKVELAIYDVTGRCVRTLLNDVESVGIHTVHWDAKNADGRRVPAGVYFVRQETAGATFSAKIVLQH